MYLTGTKAKEYPLKHVDFFDYMQKTMIRHCNAIMAEHKRKVEATKRQQGELSRRRKPLQCIRS